MNHSSARRGPVIILQEFSIPLITGVVLAVIWANLDPAAYARTLHQPLVGTGHFNFHFLINDIFMVFFFGIAAKEITEACLPGGALNPLRKAINPLMGTLGGVLGPVGMYLVWALATGDPTIVNGWGIPTATDIALAWLVARLVFGAKHPAVSFLLLLAVADDAIGLVIIAVFYPDPAHPVAPHYLGLVALAITVAYLLRRRNVQHFAAYLAVPGVLSWSGLFLAHLHPALTLVPIVPFMPSSSRDRGLYADSGEPTSSTDTLNRFEHAFKTFVDFGLLAFGLANAGVQLTAVGNATYAVLIALVVGKTLGIFAFSRVAAAAGFPLPKGMSYRCLFVAGMIAGLGLTVALFVAGVAFTDPSLQGAAKMGALLSAAIAPIALAAGRILKVKPSAGSLSERAADSDAERAAA